MRCPKQVTVAQFVFHREIQQYYYSQNLITDIFIFNSVQWRVIFRYYELPANVYTEQIRWMACKRLSQSQNTIIIFTFLNKSTYHNDITWRLNVKLSFQIHTGFCQY